jgi:uncharacterized protein
MSYKHGIYVDQASTVMPISNTSTAGIQCVVGTAPVNMLDDPASAVNTPILLSGVDDVENCIGYSSDVDKYTLMQAVHSSFEVFSVAPIIAVNVLDPASHTTEGKTKSGSMASGLFTVTETGMLLDTLAVTSEDGATTYAKGTDYTAAFNSDGTVLITRVSTSTALTATSAVKATYSILDPSKVTAADIIAGIKLIDKALPVLGYVPEILLAPGYSQDADVAAALIAAAENVSCVFKATALVDIDSAANKTIAAAIAAKTANSLYNKNAIVCYPKVITTSSITVFMSAQLGALMQYTDSQNESTPFVSPSNKTFNITAAVLSDGTQVSYTLDEANELNGEGIFTALNFMAWRSWGDNTGIYSQSKADSGTTFDVKDRYINIKRAFDWQNNGFIKRYFAKIDTPLNLHAIQTLMTDENQYYNAFIAAGYVAAMSISYSSADNPTKQLVNGTVKFRQYLTPYTPMEVIENTLQFDATALATALEGSDE